MEEYIFTYGIPEKIVTDKGTAFTGKNFRQFCGQYNIELEFGTPNLHTRTGLVERTIGSIKNLVKTFLSENFGLKDSVRKALD